MKVDWTVNIENLLTLLALFSTASAMFWKMHSRIVKIETWIELEGTRTDRALTILESIGLALAKVTTLFETQKEKLDKLSETVADQGETFVPRRECQLTHTQNMVPVAEHSNLQTRVGRIEEDIKELRKPE